MPSDGMTRIPRAEVYCQADDAILCRPCDTRIHSANKLASRHIRVELNRRPNGPLGSCPDHSGAEADMYCTDAGHHQLRWRLAHGGIGGTPLPG